MSDNNRIPILGIRQLLAEVGRHLYGKYAWQRELSRNLKHPLHDRPGTDLSTLTKWLRGVRPVPKWVGGELLRLVREVEAERGVRASRLEREIEEVCKMQTSLSRTEKKV